MGYWEDTDLPVIKLWPFYSAPKELQEQSTNGGDEDWIMLIPGEYIESTAKRIDDWDNEQTDVEYRAGYHRLDYITEKLASNDRPEFIVQEDGDLLVIGSHA